MLENLNTIDPLHSKKTFVDILFVVYSYSRLLILSGLLPLINLVLVPPWWYPIPP